MRDWQLAGPGNVAEHFTSKYLDLDLGPLLPFGHGLAYPTFEYGTLRAKGQPTIPVSMGEEKATNPFLRTDSGEIRKSLGMENAGDVAVFGEIRARKDKF